MVTGGGAFSEQSDALKSLLETVADGSGQVVIVDGRPGTGRTTAIENIASVAVMVGLRVSIARAGANPPDIAKFGDSLLAETGACFLIDDVQRAEHESLDALLRVARSVRDHSVALVLAMGPDADSGLSASLLDELRSTAGAVFFRLGALSDADADQLIGDVDPAIRDRLLHRSGGNPFLLTSLLADGSIGDEVPEVVRATVATRLARLGSDAIAVSRAVHILGADATFARVERLSAIARRAAEDATDALVRTGILRVGTTLAFIEPLVGEAVAAASDPFVLDRLERHAAEMLREDGVSAARVVPHLLRTTPTSQPWVVDQLREAAAAEVLAGDCATAAALLRRALEEPPSDGVRADVLSELAFAESRSGLPEAAERIEEALGVVTTRDARLMLLRERTRLMWLTGRLPEAVEASETALAESDIDTDLHHQLLAELLAVASMHDLSPIYARPALVALLDRANSGWVPDSPALAATLATVLPFVLGDHRLVGPLVDRAVTEDVWRVEAPPFGMRPDFVIGSLWLSDGLARGAAIVRAGMQSIEPENLFRHGLLHYWLGEIHYAAGDLPGAIASATTALAPQWGPFLSWFGFSSATLAHAYMDLGDNRAAGEAIDATEGRMDPEQLTGIAVDLARARLLLRSDDAPRAGVLAESVGDRLDALGHRDGPQIVWRPVAISAAFAAGDTSRVRTLVEEELELARATHANGRLGRALRISSAVAAPDDRLDILYQAIDVLAASERRLERALVLLALGVELHRVGDTARSRTALADARELAEACGAGQLANDALTSLHATGARPRRTAQTGLNSLTAAEQRSAELAAAGMTNREIGELLHITPRTVEWHLSRVFAKLGISSRRDLAATMHDA